jgi:hypothetical protein
VAAQGVQVVVVEVVYLAPELHSLAQLVEITEVLDLSALKVKALFIVAAVEVEQALWGVIPLILLLAVTVGPELLTL